MSRDITPLEQELLEKIITTCEREMEFTETLEGNSPILGPESALGLDSLDAVEIVSMIQTDYGVRIISKETSVEVMSSLRSIADFIEANR